MVYWGRNWFLILVLLCVSCTSVDSRLVPYTILKFQKVEKQHEDFSCAAAALSTILTYHFNDPVSEHQILEELKLTLQDQKEWETIKLHGFSVAHIRKIAEKKGYMVGSFKNVTIEHLEGKRVPVIIRIERRIAGQDFSHFVVLRGVEGDNVYLADPIWGNMKMPKEKFLKMWKGEVLIIAKEGIKGQSLLNDKELRSNEHVLFRKMLSK